MGSFKEEKPFNLLGWFSLLSFVSIGLISLFSIFMLSRFLTQNMLQRDAVVTMEFVQTIAQTENATAYFETDTLGKNKSVFENFFKKIVTMPEVVRANVYASDGTIIWSNDERFIGQRFMPNLELEVALSGRLAVKSGASGKSEKPEHVFDKEVPFFAEIYIPIWNQNEDKVVGVVEIYKVPITLFEAIKSGNRWVRLSAVFGGGFLYLSLFWIVRRAAFIIRQQHERQAAIGSENAELSKNLDLKVKELTHLQAQLVQTEKLSAIGELVSGVAHELNNPLTSIMGFSELLLSSSQEEFTQRKLEIIQKEAIRCSKIIQSLLAFSRTDQFLLKETDLSSLLRRTLELKAHHFLLDGIQVHLDLDQTLPPVLADEGQIQQVFINILNNAHQAMMEKNGQRRLIIQAVKKEAFIQIVFKDTGSGISEDFLPKIFDPFFTTKPVGVGTGLGLSVSYGIIKAHKGNLFAKSQKGVGTEMYVKLPIASGPISEIKTPVESEMGLKERLAGKRILVLDDEAPILEIIREALSIEGAEVTTASAGQEALQCLKTKFFDLILTDIKMPQMSGLEFYKAIAHEVPEMKNKVIFLTGDMINLKTKEFLAQGDHLFLNKPFEIKELVKMVIKSVGHTAPSR